MKTKKILLNLKRFDVYGENGGVNRICHISKWAQTIINALQNDLERYTDVEFMIFLPEAHLINAVGALHENSTIKIGCQGVHWEDVGDNNFGAFTSFRSAKAMKQIGCSYAMVGHSEERKAGYNNDKFNRSMQRAVEAGLSVVYCVGEAKKYEFKETLNHQLRDGLCDIDLSRVVIAYEPAWAIGPGKETPTGEYIENAIRHIKSVIGNIPVIYGGGVREENVEEIAKNSVTDGVAVALTTFVGEIGFYPDQFLDIVYKYYNLCK